MTISKVSDVVSDYSHVKSPDKYQAPTRISLYRDKNFFYSSFAIYNRSLLDNHNMFGSAIVAPNLIIKYDDGIKFDSLDLLNITKINKRIRNFPTHSISWKIQFGLKNIKDSIKFSSDVGIGKTLISNNNNIFYFMSNVLFNKKYSGFLFEPSFNLLSKNKFVNILATVGISIDKNKNNNSFYKLKLSKEINHSNSVFLEKTKDNYSIGYNYNF